MKEDRFLTGILIGIALLVVASLSVFFLRKDSRAYLPEDKPDAIVHNYIFAVDNEDYEQAYSYLADDEYKPTYTEFLRDVINTRRDETQIGEVAISDQSASVELIFTNTNGRVFSNYSQHKDTALLIEQDGDWKIVDMGYYYWSWSWYEEK